jgi:hypothetical protein
LGIVVVNSFDRRISINRAIILLKPRQRIKAKQNPIPRLRLIRSSQRWLYPAAHKTA